VETGGSWFEASLGKKSVRPCFKNKLIHACDQATWEVNLRGSQSEAGSGKYARPYLKNTKKCKKDWGHDSSDTALA
jgi:hypothetical protein